MRGMMSACSIVISAQSEAPRSPDRHLVDHDGSGRDGLRLWSRRISLRNLEENPVAGESGPTPPQFHRRAGPPIPCDRHVSIRTREDEDVGAAGGVAATPQNDGAPQEGATPKPGAVRGTQWAALGTLAFRVGRRVRISFAPAASLQTFGPSRDERLHPFTRAAVLPTGGARPRKEGGSLAAWSIVGHGRLSSGRNLQGGDRRCSSSDDTADGRSDPSRTAQGVAICRGTGSSNPVPSSGESGTNSSSKAARLGLATVAKMM
jgi:hypothetical protein